MILRIRDILIVSRYEFMFGGIFFLFVVSALASSTWSRLSDNLFLIFCGSILWYLSHMIGSQVNCISDYEFDRKNKSHLSDAVDRLGHKTIWIFIHIESLLSLVVTFYMVWLTAQPVLTILWLIGYAITMGYSLEPVRFKRRGLLNPLSLLMVLYVLPVSYGYLTLKYDADILIIVLLATVGFQMLSLIIMNALEDVPEDNSHDIKTPFVLYGVRSTSLIAFSIFLIFSFPVSICFYQLIGSEMHRLIFIILNICGQLFIIRDMGLVTLNAWRLNPDTLKDQTNFQDIRRIGRRNSIHFAILGLIISMGSALSLQ